MPISQRRDEEIPALALGTYLAVNTCLIKGTIIHK